MVSTLVFKVEYRAGNLFKHIFSTVLTEIKPS